MDNETRDLLNTILANQAILYQRIDTVYQSQIKKTHKGFFNEDAAAKELKILADKLLENTGK